MTGAGTALDAASRGLRVALVERGRPRRGDELEVLQARPRRPAVPPAARVPPGLREPPRAPAALGERPAPHPTPPVPHPAVRQRRRRVVDGRPGLSHRPVALRRDRRRAHRQAPPRSYARRGPRGPAHASTPSAWSPAFGTGTRGATTHASRSRSPRTAAAALRGRRGDQRRGQRDHPRRRRPRERGRGHATCARRGPAPFDGPRARRRERHRAFGPTRSTSLDEGTRACAPLTPAKGVHVTVPASRLAVPDRRGAPGAEGPPHRSSSCRGRTPPYTYVGTTDTAYDGSLDDPLCTPEDVDYLLGAVNATTSSNLTRDDVTGVWAGLRPLLADDDGTTHTERTADLSRRHRVRTAERRRRARDRRQVDDVPAHGRAHRRRGRPPAPRHRRGAARSRSALLGAPDRRPARPSPGLDARLAGHLAARYGTEAARRRGIAAHDPSLLEPFCEPLPYVGAELVFAARSELAVTLTDLLCRRTRAHLIDARATFLAAERAARLVAGELGWDDDRVDAEVAEYRARCAHELDAAGVTGPAEVARDHRPTTADVAARRAGDRHGARDVRGARPRRADRRARRSRRRRGTTARPRSTTTRATGGHSRSGGPRTASCSRGPRSSPGRPRPTEVAAVARGVRRGGRRRSPPRAAARVSCGGAVPSPGAVALDLTGLEGVRRVRRRVAARPRRRRDVRAGPRGVAARARLHGRALPPVLRPRDGRRVGRVPRGGPVLDALREDRGPRPRPHRRAPRRDDRDHRRARASRGRRPGPHQLFVARRARLGIVTEVELVVRTACRLPRRAARGPSTTFADGLEACRRIAAARGDARRCSGSTTSPRASGSFDPTAACSSCSTRPTRALLAATMCDPRRGVRVGDARGRRARRDVARAPQRRERARPAVGARRGRRHDRDRRTVVRCSRRCEAASPRRSSGSRGRRSRRCTSPTPTSTARVSTSPSRGAPRRSPTPTTARSGTRGDRGRCSEQARRSATTTASGATGRGFVRDALGSGFDVLSAVKHALDPRRPLQPRRCSASAARPRGPRDERAVLVVDVGTSSVRAEPRRTRRARSPPRTSGRSCPRRPSPGSSSSTRPSSPPRCSRPRCAALEEAGDVAAVGVTNQRATTVVWDAATGEPVGPGIGWQDLRTVVDCLVLQGDGVRLAPNAVRDQAPLARRPRAGRLARRGDAAIRDHRRLGRPRALGRARCT